MPYSRKNTVAKLLCVILFCISPGQGQAYQMRWCTVSDKEQQKCNQFKTVLNKLGNDSNVIASCVQDDSAINCMKKIKNGEADLITLDGGEIYRAGMIVIVKEKFVVRKLFMIYLASKVSLFNLDTLPG